MHLISKKKIFVGCHSVSEAFLTIADNKNKNKDILLIDVNWREGWKNLNAHSGIK